MGRNLISWENDEHSSNEMSGPNRWVISYADFVTLLFVLFLALYALVPKKEQRDAMEKVSPKVAQIKTNMHEETLNDLRKQLAPLVEKGDISLREDKNGILLEIKDTALFSSGAAALSTDAKSVLGKIGVVLGQKNNRLVVEGHTDNIPIQSAAFPSNWELSAARAAVVVRYLSEVGVTPDRMSATGYGDTHPVTDNTTDQNRRRNRRVSMILMDE
jgi:chemotaxis protein MotB